MTRIARGRPGQALKNAPIFRTMKALKTINGRPAGQYLDELGGGSREPSVESPE